MYSEYIMSTEIINSGWNWYNAVWSRLIRAASSEPITVDSTNPDVWLRQFYH